MSIHFVHYFFTTLQKRTLYNNNNYYKQGIPERVKCLAPLFKKPPQKSIRHCQVYKYKRTVPIIPKIALRPQKSKQITSIRGRITAL